MARPATCGRRWPRISRATTRSSCPDLRGLGLSSKPDGGYDKKTQAGDVAGVLDALKIDRVDLVTHDIGNMVGYAFAAQHPERVTRFVLIDAPVPGIGPWDEILKNPLLWHFRFGGPDMERLVAGRERIYLDRFWNEFSATPSRFTEASREHYAELYALPGAMHAGFAQFAAFDQDALDNKAFLAAKGKLDDAGAGDRRREVVRPDDGDRDAVRRQRRDRRRHSRLRPLDHGRKPHGDDRDGSCLPVVEVNGQFVACLTVRPSRASRQMLNRHCDSCALVWSSRPQPETPPEHRRNR